MIELSYSLPFSDHVQTKKFVDILRRELKTEDDKDIKILIISALGKLALQPVVDSLVIIEDLIDQVRIFQYITDHLKLKSKKLIAHVLGVLTTIGEVGVIVYSSLIFQIKPALCQRLIDLACQCIYMHLSFANPLDITHMDCKIRCSCVALLGKLTSSSLGNEVQTILSHFIKDNDPRVRQEAFQALFLLHQRGVALHMQLYDKAVKVLKDDYEEVRKEGLKLIW